MFSSPMIASNPERLMRDSGCSFTLASTSAAAALQIAVQLFQRGYARGVDQHQPVHPWPDTATP